METRLIAGDSLEVMKGLEDNSVDSVVTDPPYGLRSMGIRLKWDYDVPSVAIWEQCLRVLKPGGHLLAFAGTRTQHRMVVNIEDAGFEIRDMIAWMYGNGFPKSQNIGKSIDKVAGAEREVIGTRPKSTAKGTNDLMRGNGKKTGTANFAAKMGSDDIKYETVEPPITAPATPEAQQWDGWGTALKPALEPITVARKPFQGTVANNVLEHGTGAINIDGCRVESNEQWKQSGEIKGLSYRRFVNAFKANLNNSGRSESHPAGRWPANLIHDGTDEVTQPLNDSARFFYCAKASKTDRGEGNTHPTVKPTDLMAYLCRLVTPPGGVVPDPFMGSGSTGKAAIREGFDFIGIDLDPAYVEIAKQRINVASESLQLEL